MLMLIIAAGTTLLPAALLTDMTHAKDRPLKERVYGTPVGSDVVDLLRADTVEMYFIVNNVKDRVGVFIEACVDPSGGTDRNCENITFYFSELTYNQKSEEIFLGKERVAKSGGSAENMVIFKPFALGYEVERKLIDTGFDKHVKAEVKVYLGKE
jgi:hypothetical protein